jgi:hypothetical protein
MASLAREYGASPAGNQGQERGGRGSINSREEMPLGFLTLRARKTSTCLGRTFRRFEARLGGKKAVMAAAHNMLVMVSHLLAEGTLYDEERNHRLSPQPEERQRRRAVQALQALSYRVT